MNIEEKFLNITNISSGDIPWEKAIEATKMIVADFEAEIKEYDELAILQSQRIRQLQAKIDQLKGQNQAYYNEASKAWEGRRAKIEEVKKQCFACEGVHPDHRPGCMIAVALEMSEEADAIKRLEIEIQKLQEQCVQLIETLKKDVARRVMWSTYKERDSI